DYLHLGPRKKVPPGTHAQYYYYPTHPHARANVGRGFLGGSLARLIHEASHTPHTHTTEGPVPAQAFEEGLRHALRNAEGHQIESLLKHLAIENGCCLRVRGCRRI